MLGSFMEEMQITPEQFELACIEGRNLNILSKDEPSDNHSFSFHRGLFQQIWAANDIRIFVRLMIQRNVELQLQALDLIERRQASLHGSENGDTSSPSIDKVDEEEEREIEKFVEAEINSQGGSSSSHGSTSDQQSTANEDNNKDEKQLNFDNNDDDKFQRLNLFFEKERIKTSDISERQEYLRSQRDKILQIKKQARARQLNEMTKERPTSARAAKIVLEGGPIEPDESSMAVRKMLAKRLRDEVVNKEWMLMNNNKGTEPKDNLRAQSVGSWKFHHFNVFLSLKFFIYLLYVFIFIYADVLFCCIRLLNYIYKYETFLHPFTAHIWLIHQISSYTHKNTQARSHHFFLFHILTFFFSSVDKNLFVSRALFPPDLKSHSSLLCGFPSHLHSADPT